MFYNKKQRLFAYAFILVISAVLTACGIWTDFTTYFNTYYNAKTLFDITEEAIQKQKTDPFVFREEEEPTNNRQTNQYQQQQQQYRPPTTNQYNNTNTNQTGTNAVQTLTKSQINQNLTKVIEKCSKILEYDKESSYFDDALFITGKSFYYQGEYARAQRKFLELATIPESDFALENKLWLAKTYLQLRSFDDGLKLLEDVKNAALEQDNHDLFLESSYTKIGFLVYREEYQSAINECQNFLKSVDDDEIAALVWYQMGKIFMEQGDSENALNAYASVLKYSPSYDIEFESRLQHALLLKKLGKLDESENEIEELGNEGKFQNKLDRVLLELGKIYYDKDDNELAVKTFMEIDSTYRNTPTSGEASFMLGKIYEKKFGVYDSAYKYYLQTASSRAPYDIKLDAGEFSRAIDKYFTMKGTINEVNKSLLYLTEPTRFMQDSIDYELAYKDFMADVKYKADSLENLQNQQNVNISTPNKRKIIEQQAQAQMQQEALRIAKNPPLGYNPTLKDLIIQGKVKKPAMPKMTTDSAKGIIAKDYYDLGKLFFADLDVPDSAYYYYKLVLNDYPDSAIIAPTLFALGTYYETEDQNQKADSLYQIIYDNHPKDKLYTQAGIKLGKIKPDENALLDASNDPAQPSYLKAENEYYDKKYASAINELRNLYLNYPGSPFVPKAMYFIGMIYENELDNPDSAAVFYGILASKEYANTPYGRAVSPKYLVYKNEKERIEKEKQDELKKQEELKNKTVSDSLGTNNSVTDSAAAAMNKIENGRTRNIVNDERKPAASLSDEDSTKVNIKKENEMMGKHGAAALPDSAVITKDKIQSEHPKNVLKNKGKTTPHLSEGDSLRIRAREEELLRKQDSTAVPDSSKKVLKNVE